MTYKVDFVGLVCFYRERGARLALLPDGREPDPGIAPHYGTIRVSPDDVLAAEGWEASNELDDGIFVLPPCEVIIDGASQPGSLDVSDHDQRLPQLSQIDPNFEIDPASARTIAKVRIVRGTLRVFQIPEGTALVSQLEVDHDGPVDITVQPDDGSAPRTIRIAAGAEIVIANMAKDGIYQRDRNVHDDHFKLYERLSFRPVMLNEPDSISAANELSSRHPLFAARGPISLYVDCTNTGCC
jgi:hypothetical protein